MHRHITIGIAGHTGHGKTALARCLTGFEHTVSVPEKRSTLTNKTEISELDVAPGMRAALIDVPGHQRLLKNAIRGLSAVDLCILVVAADDGMMPQTFEHLKIIHHLKIAHGLIVLSKADLVDPELLELAELEIKDAVQHTVFSGKPVIPFSPADAGSKERLLSCIQNTVEEIPGKDPDAVFRMWIDEVISAAGFGTVACGTVLSGTVSQTIHYVCCPLSGKPKPGLWRSTTGRRQKHLPVSGWGSTCRKYL